MNTKPIITARQKLEMEMTLKLRRNSCFLPIRLMSAESWTFMVSEYGEPSLLDGDSAGALDCQSLPEAWSSTTSPRMPDDGRCKERGTGGTR